MAEKKSKYNFKNVLFFWFFLISLKCYITQKKSIHLKIHKNNNKKQNKNLCFLFLEAFAC